MKLKQAKNRDSVLSSNYTYDDNSLSLSKLMMQNLTIFPSLYWPTLIRDPTAVKKLVLHRNVCILYILYTQILAGLKITILASLILQQKVQYWQKWHHI